MFSYLISGLMLIHLWAEVSTQRSGKNTFMDTGLKLKMVKRRLSYWTVLIGM